MGDARFGVNPNRALDCYGYYHHNAMADLGLKKVAITLK